MGPLKQPAQARGRRKYVPAVGHRLRKLLLVVFGLFAVLGVNSVYLGGVSLLEWSSGQVYQNWLYLIMFLVHLGLGFLLIIPLLVFGITHIYNAHNRPNRRAVYVGYGLFSTALVLLISGLLLTRVEVGGVLVGVLDTGLRRFFYWVHIISPIAAAWLFVLHRLAGRRIRWRVGATWAVIAVVLGIGLLLLQRQDPRNWNVAGNPSGDRYFQPSLSRTVTGNFIPARILDNDAYCQECHQDIHRSWRSSVHRLASFNNPAYFATVRETRRAVFERDGTVQAARFCAGCHDPVPFFSGEFDHPRFDSPDYNLAQDPMANAGITCTSCHAITHINTPRGNADYTIEEPIHYPFTFSENKALRWINRQLVKAKPDFHKKTFLKPLHRSTEFCGTCHKVHLPKALNGYKWLRGQNHYDSFYLSGVSGIGVASFYYPEKAEANCNGCHMPLQSSSDFGARDFDGTGEAKVHNHQFPSANTAIPYLMGEPEAVLQAHRDFLQDIVRVDLFGIREGGRIDGRLRAPLRPQVPVLSAGGDYLIEAVVRTLKLGHLLTQGTADSNQLWLEMQVLDGDRVIAGSGLMDREGQVDKWAHFINAYVLDREGNRIATRNAQDIFVALYDNQIAPGAADVVHYLLKVPAQTSGRLQVRIQLKYRKFDTQYLKFFQGAEYDGNDLPVTILAEDEIVLPVAGASSAAPKSTVAEWERWNDYGIGLLRRGQLRQAEEAFLEVEKLGRPEGALNLARVYLQEGRVQVEAPQALARAGDAPPWSLLWFSGLVNFENGRYREAARDFGELVKGGFAEAKGRGFDFSRDYRLLNQLGRSVFQTALQQRGASRSDPRQVLLRESVEWFRKALEYDPENVEAHWGLRQAYRGLGEAERALEHDRLHARYKPDDNARDRATALARRRDPAANRAAERVVIYDLQHPSLGEFISDQ